MVSAYERRIAGFLRRSPFFIVAGLAFWPIAKLTDVRVGMFTSIAAVLSGACGGTIQGECRTVRGRRLAATLFLPGLLGCLAIYGCAAYRALADGNSLAYFLDSVTGAVLLADQVLFLWAILKADRALVAFLGPSCADLKTRAKALAVGMTPSEVEAVLGRPPGMVMPGSEPAGGQERLGQRALWCDGDGTVEIEFDEDGRVRWVKFLLKEPVGR